MSEPLCLFRWNSLQATSQPLEFYVARYDVDGEITNSSVDELVQHYLDNFTCSDGSIPGSQQIGRTLSMAAQLRALAEKLESATKYRHKDPDNSEQSQKSCPSGVEHLPSPSESIDALYMTARTARRLKEAGINTISDMLDLNEAEALKIQGFGRKSIYEIELQIADYGGLRAFRGGCKA
ncbi:DNA-directed RNA polymerase subunit alpha C-terminal domain-containing protein [Vreelandella indica]|uniref:DNA-directed RNA polymerase subunit alpha C-terminal domain-containing protein n=1 Tax=Vreelandella indica TaxID=3126500 RepID=UPI00300E1674